MGYTLEEHLPSAERPNKRDLFTKTYLQIAVDMPPDRIIVLNLQEFSTLVAKAVIEISGVRIFRAEAHLSS